MIYRMSVRGFSLCKGALLVAAILLSQALPTQSREAIPLETQDIIAELSHGFFDVYSGDLQGQAWLLGDGRVTIEMPVGRFDGRWRAFEDTLCFEFRDGPMPGLTCRQVATLGRGWFATDEGTLLERRARTQPIE